MIVHRLHRMRCAREGSVRTFSSAGKLRRHRRLAHGVDTRR